MAIFKLYVPTNGHCNIHYSPNEDRIKRISGLLEQWKPYCEANWISAQHEAIDAPEKKVKRMLDSAANFILYCNSDDVVTPYKAKKHIANEVPLSFVLDVKCA